MNNLLEKPREPSGELLAQCQTDDPAQGHGPYYFYHFDELGSTRAITHQDGYVVATYDYDAYGKVIHTTGSFQQPYQFVGQLGYYTHHQAPEFGWLQLGVRFYEPELGRFERRDPVVRFMFGSYQYADGRPHVLIDPSGKVAWFIPVGCGIAISALIEARCIHVVREQAQDIHDRNQDKVAHCFAVCRAIKKCKLPPDTALWYADFTEEIFRAVDSEEDKRANLIGTDCATSPGAEDSCYACCLKRTKHMNQY